MKSKFAIRGHALHPLLVGLPIGLFTWTLVADIVYMAIGDMVWYEIARWSEVAAIVSGVAAAVPGIGDFLTLPFAGKTRWITTIHMLLNLMVVGAFIVAAFFMFSEFLMIGNNATVGVLLYIAVALHAAGVLILMVSGWLGGEVVFRHHIGMVPEAEAIDATTSAGDEARPRPREHERAHLGR
jgi:uncharacterized membrane protein